MTTIEYNNLKLQVSRSYSCNVGTSVEVSIVGQPAWAVITWNGDVSFQYSNLSRRQERFLGFDRNAHRKRTLLSLASGVESTEAFAVGDGEWSLEVRCCDGSIVEYVGSNGTRGAASDLYAHLHRDVQVAGRYAKLFA